MKEYLWRAYAAFVRVARKLAERIGLLNLLDRKRGNFWCYHLRSQFAVRNVADMIELDTPWWTYKAIAEVERFLSVLPKKARVFEYGAGASTVWLAKRCAEVISVEHDEGFAAMLDPYLKPYANIRLLVKSPVPVTAAMKEPILSTRAGHEGNDFTAYVKSIEDAGGKFDLIVVDGLVRAHCLEKAKAHLAPGGLIVFDNSNKPKFRRAIAASGLAATPCYGLTPCLPHLTETTLLRAS